MKEKLINNLGLKILSIFLAFFVWLVVVNVSNPEVNRSKEVALDIENEAVLTAAQRTYEIIGKNTVTVSYDVRTRDEYKVRATDFRAYVDLAELYDVTGSVQVKIEVLNNREIIANAEAKPGVIRVVTEELQSKQFELVVSTPGETEDGYALNGVTLSPAYVVVEGPVSQVGLISYVGVVIDINGLNADSEGVVTPIFYDANGNELSDRDRLRLNSPEIHYKLVINKVKQLPLDFEVSGTVAPGYQYTGVECSESNVAVIGLKSSLAALNKITIPASELNLNGATTDKLVSVDLRNHLPPGVELAESESPIVEVRLRVERLVDRTITLTEGEILRENETEGMRYRLTPNRIEVKIRGLREDLESLSASDLKATLNLAGLGAGTHTAVLGFAESDVFSVVSVADFTVEVIQGDGGPGSTTAASESGSEESPSQTSGQEGTTEAVPEQETAASTGSDS